MTFEIRAALTLTIFVAMLALVIARPRGASEAWWTVLAAASMLALHLVTPQQAIDVMRSGSSAISFLVALLWLSHVVRKSGFFDWAAERCARLAAGDAHALFRNTFVLGAMVTATLSLDTTAVILTPIVIALVKRLGLPLTPYVLACALVSNVGSLLLPVSNLTNILFVDAFHTPFSEFTLRMAAPQIVAWTMTFGLLRWRFRRELPARFVDDMPSVELVPHAGYFRACTTVLALVLVGCFLAPWTNVPPYAVAFAGAALLTLVGLFTRRVTIGSITEVSWSVVPFVLALFVAVRGVESLGIVDAAAAIVARTSVGSPARLFLVAGGTALASNVINNLPATLVARSVLEALPADPASALAALIGADVGSTITPFGSLATMLVLTLARREGAVVPTRDVVTFGLWATPLLVLAATLSLVVVYALVP